MSDQDKAKKPKKPSRSQLRSASRSFALQALYQWQMNHSSVNEIEAQFAVDHDMSSCDKTYFRELVYGVASKSKALDEQFENTDDYLENTLEFQRTFLPYGDTRNLIAAILFYEEIMKSLHQYKEFR